ncbi:hypothetical protein [Streptomyces sp. NPDC051211]|uniref:hypothetical protein n=1 Tax=Streptomyces sp. NPDC051211 TaxID=3154643 RepID=UPI00344F4A85
MTGQNEHEHEGRQAPRDDLGVFEVNLRQRMAEDAQAVRPAAVPYPAIVRQGRLERRRRLAAAGAALAVLAVVPAAAFAFSGNGEGTESTQMAGPSPTSPAPRQAGTTPAPKPTGPAAPATPGQLADGITMEQAAEGLEKCLGFNRTHLSSGPGGAQDLGKPADYRILLAQRSTGNDNSPGDGQYIVALKDGPAPNQTRLICNIKQGEAQGMNTSVSNHREADSGAVAPDINGGKLFLQRLSTEGPWKLPYRWGSIGTVDARVAKVTVTYGGTTVEAALDHGWFAATGILDRPVTKSPRIKGYDAKGEEIYDSDRDKGYDKLIP